MLQTTRYVFCFLFLLAIFSCLMAQPAQEISIAEKKKFLKLLEKLPKDSDNEFFTEEAVTQAAPYIAVLFALTEKDVDENHIPPLLALSRDFCDREESRSYGLKHFAAIQHPIVKLFWAAVLFDGKVATPEMVEYLRAAINSKEQSKTLSEMIGPQYEEFKQRVLAYPAESK